MIKKRYPADANRALRTVTKSAALAAMITAAALMSGCGSSQAEQSTAAQQEATVASEAAQAMSDLINGSESSSAEAKEGEEAAAEPEKQTEAEAETGEAGPAEAVPAEDGNQPAEETVVIEENVTPLGLAETVTLYAADAADVHVSPDELSDLLTTLDKGAAVTTIGQENGWTRAVIGDQVGYVLSELLAETLPEEEPEEKAEETETAEEAAEEKAAEPAAGAAELQEKKVSITSSRCTVMTEGDYVLLSSKIEGFDGLDVVYQWECDQGNGFQPVESANNDTYVFKASTESLSWDWRLTVYYR